MCPPSLLDLPNCIILQLLSYLEATSLYLLSRTCERLDSLVKTSSLWKHIDSRSFPNDVKKLKYCTERIYGGTHTFLTKGDNQNYILLLPQFYFKINQYNTLRILSIENQLIEGSQYSIMSFPKSLNELSLKKTMVLNSSKFIRNSGEHLQELRVLILDECKWVTSSAFMAISKYKNLEILSVYKCRSVENSIPYLSLSGQYGFRKLKILDARLSPLGNTLIHSLYRSQSILAIYLQNEDITYKLDYFKHQLQLRKNGGSPQQEDKDFNLDDYLNNEENGLNYDDPTGLSDYGLLDYISTVSNREKYEMPQSRLYKDPYNPCTCGYEEHQTKASKDGKPPPHDQDDDEDNDDNDDGGDLQNKIKRLTEIIEKNRTNRWQSREVNLHQNGENFHQDGSNICVMTLPASHMPPQCVINVLVNPPNRERKRGLKSSKKDAPELKKAKTDAEAGPSGLNNVTDSDSEHEEIVELRDPEPSRNGNNEYRRIYFRDSAIIRIDNINEIRNDYTVALKRLSLRGYKKITNTSLAYIKNLDLELLDLTYTNVSVDGINNYLVDHPFCRIVHEKFCVCPPNLHF